jgi:hypothetical protein
MFEPRRYSNRNAQLSINSIHLLKLTLCWPSAQICSREDAAEARQEVEARLRSRQDLTEEQVAALMTAEVRRRC